MSCKKKMPSRLSAFLFKKYNIRLIMNGTSQFSNFREGLDFFIKNHMELNFDIHSYLRTSKFTI